MKCEEMMNLMQQSLDQDLTAEEERAMLAHLKQCPGCSDLYVRLKLLHEELAQLPKVKPAYSIVDAILPQLEEMPLWSVDSAEGPETSAAAKEQVVALPEAPVRRSRRGLISWRIFSGVAAAGIVIGLLLSNQDNLNLNKTASESVALESRMGAPQAASGAEENNKEAPPSEAGGAHNSAVVPTQTEAVKAAPSAMPEPSPEAGTEPKDLSGRVTMASPADSYMKDQFGQMQQQSAAEDRGTAYGAASEPSEVKQEQVAGNPEAADSVPESLPGETSDEKRFSLTIADQAGAGETAPEPEQGDAASSLSADADAKRVEVQSLAGFAAAEAPEPLTSPDGLYTASVADGKVTITNKDGASVFVSSIHLGPEVQVRFGEWTDAHTFSYTVRTVSGTETVYVISAAKGKEWKK